MSRLALAKPAQRQKAPAKLMISAGEGGGKTETALHMARGLAGPHGDILFIDTEGAGRASLLYADEHDFTHIPWDAPYPPEELAADILAAAARYSVIVIDSVYSFWSGEGGVLDKADKGAPGNGSNKFAGWKVARPAHRKLVNAIIDCRAHVIICCRAKVDYVQVPGPDGRLQVRALGMQPVQDDFLPAEVNLHLRMDATTHEIEVAKSRIRPIPQGTVYAGDQAIDVARTYAEWSKGGEPLADNETVAWLEAALNAIPEKGDLRREAKFRFLDQYGRPQYLRESEVDGARGFAAQLADEAAEVVGSGPTRPTLTAAPAPADTAGADPVDSGRLASWVNLSERLPSLLGVEAEGFKQWMRDGNRSWRPATASSLDEIVAEARRRFRDTNGGARQWDAGELAEVRLLLDELKDQPRDWDDFREVAFENLADAGAPETWTDRHLTAFSTWIRIGSAPPSSTEGTDAHDHPQQHDHAA
jgi:hypothetical protein